MGLLHYLLGRFGNPPKQAGRGHTTALAVEPLETRELPAASASLAGGILSITGSQGKDRINVFVDEARSELVVQDARRTVARFASAAVGSISISALGGDDVITVAANVIQPTLIDGGAGKDVLRAGGGFTTLLGGAGTDFLFAGAGITLIDGGAGKDFIFGVKSTDTVVPDAADRVFQNLDPALLDLDVLTTLSTEEVEQLLRRAAAASASEDGIFVIVDRGGRILGVRTEAGVSPAITGNVNNLVFAIDGALSLARTGAFFGNDQAPLTSRTVQFISQSTITQREVESNPSITDPNSTLRGSGFVAPIGVRGHFPPNVQFTPQVDLFQIEHTNRDTTFHPGADRILGANNGALLAPDDVRLPNRFNVAEQFINPAIPLDNRLVAPNSYGFVSGLLPGAQPRGIGTLPGGIPIFKNGVVVGGIGVFFPGTTGFATASNSALDALYDRNRPDRAQEAEYIAFAALGGAPGAGAGIGTLGGVAPVAGISLPAGRIDLVGITLDIFGPGGSQGIRNLLAYARDNIRPGNPNSGVNRLVDPGADGTPGTPDDVFLRAGRPVPAGWLVTPHDGNGISATDVIRIINQGIAQAGQTRAAIRLPLGSRTRMTFAVTDLDGNVLGLFRMGDSTVFSIDVAVAKARNVAYYNDAGALQAADRLEGVAPGVAFTNRTFRYLGLPRYPEGIDGNPPGPFSQLNDPGQNRFTALNNGPPQPASAFQSVVGYDAFNPQTNFRDPSNILNQNGIVFFPGSSGIYIGGRLVGGFGVSGDGVDQDDVVTAAGIRGYGPPPGVLRADQVFVRGVRLPYNKFNRNPEG